MSPTPSACILVSCGVSPHLEGMEASDACCPERKALKMCLELTCPCPSQMLPLHIACNQYEHELESAINGNKQTYHKTLIITTTITASNKQNKNITDKAQSKQGKTNHKVRMNQRIWALYGHQQQGKTDNCKKIQSAVAKSESPQVWN